MRGSVYCPQGLKKTGKDAADRFCRYSPARDGLQRAAGTAGREYRMFRIVQEDMAYIARKTEGIRPEGGTVLVSGATGLVGNYLVRFLAGYCGCRVLAVVRDEKKARRLWRDLGDRVEYIRTDITKLEAQELSVDYMVHGAGMTASRSFAMQPVEVINTFVEGTKRMLEFARKNPVKSFLFLSTMEVYGAPATEERITERYGSSLDTMAARSSYPESKRLCESMCAAYGAEYQVPVRVVRLTQTMGPGVAYQDTRVFAEFARCAMEKRDIVLHTAGETKRSYLYLADACTAILTVMMRGKDGEAYNAANEGTWCSIRQMAEMVAGQVACGGIGVRVEPDRAVQTERGYAPVLYMNLDTAKLQALGWKPEIDLPDMYRRMIACMQEEEDIVRSDRNDSKGELEGEGG